MSDINYASNALKTTVQTLKAAGVDHMTIAISLAKLSVDMYKDIAPMGDLTEHDVKMLFKTLSINIK